MADDACGEKPAVEHSTASTSNKNDLPTSKPKKGILSRIWHGLFRRGGDDFEKKLKYLSTEEASVHSRIKRRAQTWRSMARNLVIYSVLLEVAALVYAIITTRSLDLDWKMRALRVIPIFAIPGLATAIYSTLSSYKSMRDSSDQKTLERLHAERKAKIDELKERTNYYLTQQLIQRYDTDPAAKAAAASVLASKLGEDSGLKVFVEDEQRLNIPFGKSNDAEVVPSTGLHNRKSSSHRRSNSVGNILTREIIEEVPTDAGLGGQQFAPHNQTVTVSHHKKSTTHDSGWIARIAAMLVGEDPSQCYALICGNCHMHNGLARKEDFSYISYYCPHCHVFNSSNQHDTLPSGSSSKKISPPPSDDGQSGNDGPVSESNAIFKSTSSPEIARESEVKQSDAAAS